MGQPLDYRVIGRYGQQDENKNQPLVADEATECQRAQSLGTLHKADLAVLPQPLGPRPDIADHQRTGNREEEDPRNAPFVATDEIGADPEVNENLGIAVRRRIQQGAELRFFASLPGDLSVQNIAQTCHQHNEGAPVQEPLGKGNGRPQVHHQSHQRQPIGRETQAEKQMGQRPQGG